MPNGRPGPAHPYWLEGEKSPNAKLTDAAVTKIRAADPWPAGPSDSDWAERYGASKAAIRHARLRRTWKHLP